MAKWYREALTGVQATQATQILWDGGAFTIPSRAWLAVGDHGDLKVLSDDEWRMLDDCMEEDAPRDAKNYEELRQALLRGSY